MRTIDQMIQSEVLCCMSHIVATLAGGSHAIHSERGLARDNGASALNDLASQAFEIASPIADYEEAAIQAGWVRIPGGDLIKDGQCGFDAQEICEDHDIEPYDREVFEHWAVTDWFADKLIEAGEKVDKDFGNLCIWARTTTGQGIASDGVVERIYAATHQKEPA